MKNTIISGNTVVVFDLTTAELNAVREEWRETASLPRADFVNAAADAGLLTDDEAIEAAKGGWPASFDAALTSLDTAGKRRAKVLWASVIDIHRNADLIGLIIASTIPLTATQVDTLFGYSG